ncbi:MAG: hypothetical protein Q8R50_15095 [Sediminibacterium sp.]|nr:hypothetical protein [Sediminibacterium sp.]
MSTATELIHGIPIDTLPGAIPVPICQTSTFVQAATGVNKGYNYARKPGFSKNRLKQELICPKNIFWEINLKSISFVG